MRRQPVRRGIQVNTCLDPDAHAMLAALATGPRGYGKLLSELIRREYALRCRLLDALPPAQQRTGGAP